MSSIPQLQWSQPDADGIVTCTMDVGAVSTLRGRRKRRGGVQKPESLLLWPIGWRNLLKEWLKGKARRKWTTLLSIAGAERTTESWKLLDALLAAGLAEVEERRESVQWQPVWVEFSALEEIREQLGLPHRGKLHQEWEEKISHTLNCQLLTPLLDSLDKLPVVKAVRRHELLFSLDRWIDEKRNGTRRDFALFARGDTKGISTAEWEWLAIHLDLEYYGITKHTPAIWLRAPLTIFIGIGRVDLECIPDCIGLSPETLNQISSIAGKIQNWLILENRTVFERVARNRGEQNGVLWIPGFAPGWWKDAVARLLDNRPAPARIACDPDPAGIEIALGIGKVWEEHGIAWEPWGMNAEALSAMTRKKLLTDDDRSRLQRLLLQPLPDPIQGLAYWMLEHSEKGEQEGNDDIR